MAGRFRFQNVPRRGPGDPWFRIGSLDVTTTIFVVLIGVVSMFLWAGEPSIIRPLILDPYKVRHGELWRLVTWPLYNPPSLNAVIIIAVFWFLGRDLESLLGRIRFALFLLLITVLPAIVATLVNAPQGSLRYIEIGVLVAFAAERPTARFFFGIPAWAIALVIVGIEILQFTGSRTGSQLIFLAVLCVTAVFALRAFGFGDAIAKWIPQIKLPKRKPKRARGAAAGGPVVVQGPWSPATTDDAMRQARIDSLLDKIAASGLDSLTPEERKWLNDASKRSRDDRR